MAATRKISAEELAKHTAYDDCWMAIQGKVYDLTKFMDDHPGGDEVLKDSAGRDATAEFDDVGHSEEAWAMMEEYYIGDFADAGKEKATPKPVASAAATAKAPKAEAPSGGSMQRILIPVLIILIALIIRYFFL
mmetsp:Transcript_11780/g.47562  ORF Transcript_11780/g.47562 Transcript_11780/m.47562 type:complete len:134 (+) Transcript_11780:291-692(+)|eukprot:CAMPEP_0114617104 /NCGR_PEP_ID=MMETSP0168-20121206/7026_1 /TAXON_ID=95228 ORGANISM="Vannella sp., Strain DIVA3 517/6/12" /NCGR_SAMPLE_ID=MMETSP0168 /ASSEMBLY_ACC=CAM_ASM_000044 /LENGTH=133 /DNA_ID=CAMNT_0001828231 /DNA_START=263 /DNA_END=664 /DNA_ORIENTATION=-